MYHKNLKQFISQLIKHSLLSMMDLPVWSGMSDRAVLEGLFVMVWRWGLGGIL